MSQKCLKKEEKEFESLKVKSNRAPKTRYGRRISIIFVSVVSAIYLLFPFVFWSSTWLRRQVVFMNYVNLSPKVNFSNPQSTGLKCSRNLYLSSENKIVLGVWHIIPHSKISKKDMEDCITKTDFKDKHPVILYVHGSGGNRGARHRIAMYKKLSQSKLDAHVVTFDYRGFGDSSNHPPSTEGVVTDSFVVYKWLESQVKSTRIFLWCHSMGAAVCLRLIATRSILPKGIILESPFFSIEQAITDHPLMVFYRNIPTTFYYYLFVEPIRYSDTNFDNEQMIVQVKSPILILHAEDDMQVPYHQAENLYQTALQKQVDVNYICYNASLGYGHVSISKDPDLINQIATFMKKGKI